jgi:hypothetical protein
MGEEKQPQPKKPSVPALIVGGIGAVVGVVVGQYAGAMLLFPGGFALLAGWVFSKTVPEENKPMVPASAVQAGQGLWMLLSMVLLSQFDLIVVDFVILAVGAIWLAFRPSAVLVAALICYQAFGMALNGMAFAQAAPRSVVHRALLVHLVLRATAIVLMVFGLIQIEKRKKLAAQASEPGQVLDAHVNEATDGEPPRGSDRE